MESGFDTGSLRSASPDASEEAISAWTSRRTWERGFMYPIQGWVVHSGDERNVERFSKKACWICFEEQLITQWILEREDGYI
jgi:hypothetical protein